MHSHYDVLKVALDAPGDVVRAAYRVFAARHHPDRAGPAELALMQRVNEAYRVLSDPALRAAHDAWIRTHRRRRAADAPAARPTVPDAGTVSPHAAGHALDDAASVAPTHGARAGHAAPATHALPHAALLVERARRQRIAAAYAAHAPRSR